MLKGNMKWSMGTDEAIYTLRHLLSDHQTFAITTVGNTLEVDLSKVDKQTLRQDVFEWLKRRTK